MLEWSWKAIHEKNKDFLIVPNFHFSQSGVKVSGIEQQRVADYWSSFFSQQIAGTGKAAMNKDHGLVYRWLLFDFLLVYKSHLFRHVIGIIPLWNICIRSFIYLFDQLEKRKDDATFVIKASYLEIYNEKVKLACSQFINKLLASSHTAGYRLAESGRKTFQLDCSLE